MEKITLHNFGEYKDTFRIKLSNQIEEAIWEQIKDYADNGESFDWEVSFNKVEEEE